MIQSLELQDLFKKIVIGVELVRAASASPISPRRLEIFFSHDVAELVLLLDGVQSYLPALRLRLKNSSLKHLLILVSRPEELRWLVESVENRDLFETEGLDWGCVSKEEGVPLEEYQNYWTGKEPGLHLQKFSDPQTDSLEGLYADLEKKHRYVIANRSTWGGSVEDEFIAFRQSLQNIPHFLQRPDFRNWQKGFENRPVFVIGAGPSLDQEVEFVRRFQDRAIVIAADTLYRKLSEAEIHPHIFVSLERISLVATLFKSKEWNRSILVAPQVMPPEALSIFAGPQALFLLPHVWNSFLKFRRVVMQTGHSCVGVGLSLANVLTRKATYLFGIDLCFGEDLKSHSNFSPYRTPDFAEADSAIEEWRKDAVPILNRNAKQVMTHLYWLRFREDFESIIARAKAPFFVTSKEGLRLKGSQEISYSDFEAQLSSLPSFDAYEELQASLTYDRNAEAHEDLRLFKESLKKLEGVVIAHSELFKNPSSQWEPLLLSIPYGPEVLGPILKSGFMRLNSKIPELEKHGQESIEKVWRDLPEVLRSARQSLDEFQADRLY